MIQHDEKSTFVLRGLLQDVEAELRDEQNEFGNAAKATQASEVNVVFTLQAYLPPMFLKSC